MEKGKRPIHFTEMKKRLDICKIRNQLVNLRCWELKSGDIINYEGWMVIGSHWRGGTHRLKNYGQRTGKDGEGHHHLRIYGTRNLFMICDKRNKSRCSSLAHEATPKSTQ